MIIFIHPIMKPVANNDKSSAVAEMGDRLATIDMGRKERTGYSSALEYPNGLFLSLA